MHIKKIEEVYQRLEGDKKLDVIISTGGDIKKLIKKLRESIFIDAINNIDKNIKIEEDDMSALKEGMRLEEISEKYYDELIEEADDPFEKRFYLTLAKEERGHYLLLSDSYEYLTHPESWLLLHEKHLLDGG